MYQFWFWRFFEHVADQPIVSTTLCLYGVDLMLKMYVKGVFDVNEGTEANLFILKDSFYFANDGMWGRIRWLALTVCMLFAMGFKTLLISGLVS